MKNNCASPKHEKDTKNGDIHYRPSKSIYIGSHCERIQLSKGENELPSFHVSHISKALNRTNEACKRSHPVLKYSALTPQKIKLLCFKPLIRALFIYGFIL